MVVRRPGRRPARRDQRSIGETGLFSSRASPLEDGDLMAVQCQLMRAADANNACTHDRNFQTHLPENCILQALKTVGTVSDMGKAQKIGRCLGGAPVMDRGEEAEDESGLL